MSLISLIDVLYVVLYTYCLIPGGKRLYVVLHIVLYRVEDVFYVVLYIVLYRVVDVSALDVTFQHSLNCDAPRFFFEQSFAEMVYTQGGLNFATVGRHALVQGNTLFQVCGPISFHFACSLHTVRSSAPNEALPTTTYYHSIGFVKMYCRVFVMSIDASLWCLLTRLRDVSLSKTIEKIRNVIFSISQNLWYGKY